MTIVQPAPAIICSVLGERRGRSMQFRGRIVSQDMVDGTYRFAIAKAGPSGRNAISQTGQFSALPGIETFVGSATLSIEPGAAFDARMTLEVGGHRIDCAPFVGEKI